ncbi:CBS domain-containing protein [Litoribrevibacter albus]|uniref:CBS domain-containing protein n=1 Tax=Litoribrevibacter albus TaxID=1473156 RepID=A0AA37S980_9GAMM|nr:CBS domain-containing protein [Litoribrevibacter albus]GLQ31732.1 hypothetical protein GCM10007876_22110 [Litoribrevibacter albus]
MKKFKLHPVSTVDELAWPDSADITTMDTPAIEFFTDFYLVQPLVLSESMTAVQARETMVRSHVRLKFVIDTDDHFVGVISSDDLIERKIVQKVAEGYGRDDIPVSELMTPKRDLMALSIEDVEKATIEDVVNVLKDYHQQHCLVVDPSTHKIRGIFSSSDISRKLKLPINIQDQSDFYRVFSAIN